MKNKFLAIILTALCLVGCTKKSSDTTENTNKKSDLSKSWIDRTRKKNSTKIKRRNCYSKAETNKIFQNLLIY